MDQVVNFNLFNVYRIFFIYEKCFEFCGFVETEFFFEIPFLVVGEPEPSVFASATNTASSPVSNPSATNVIIPMKTTTIVNSSVELTEVVVESSREIRAVVTRSTSGDCTGGLTASGKGKRINLSTPITTPAVSGEKSARPRRLERVLVADDSKFSRDILQMLLNQLGCVKFALKLEILNERNIVYSIVYIIY